jgi:hypothetical protein
MLLFESPWYLESNLHSHVCAPAAGPAASEGAPATIADFAPPRADERWPQSSSAPAQQLALRARCFPDPGLIPPLPEQPAWAFDTEQCLELQPCVCKLAAQIVGVVEEGCCEPLGSVRRISVLAICEIALDDGVECRVTQPAADEAIQD